jgi:dienelactone hydrolase
MEDFDRFDCAADGVVMRGFAVPHESATGAALVMFPGATGRGPSFDAAARDLAACGYRVFGASVYDASLDTSTPAAAGEAFSALLANPQSIRERATAWIEAVGRQPGVDPARIAAIGYCFGGKCVLEIARSGADIAVAVAYHALLETHAPAAPGTIRTRIAVYAGGRDPYAPVSHIDGLRAELDRAGAQYHLHLFANAQHSFMDPDHDGIQDGIAYDPVAHRIAWSGTIALLDACLSG